MTEYSEKLVGGTDSGKSMGEWGDVTGNGNGNGATRVFRGMIDRNGQRAEMYRIGNGISTSKTSFVFGPL